MIYLTADWHLTHKNIIDYCKRPFKTVLEMDNALIENFNKVVKKEDHTFILGDFSFCTTPILFTPLLNGSLSFVRGNHDHGSFWTNQPHTIILKKFGKTIQMTHDPKHLLPGCDINICGHVHEKWLSNGEAINVGVDVWNFHPVSLKHIIANYDKIISRTQKTGIV